MRYASAKRAALSRIRSGNAGDPSNPVTAIALKDDVCVFAPNAVPTASAEFACVTMHPCCELAVLLVREKPSVPFGCHSIRSLC